MLKKRKKKMETNSMKIWSLFKKHQNEIHLPQENLLNTRTVLHSQIL